jgi:hypothetical protein
LNYEEYEEDEEEEDDEEDDEDDEEEEEEEEEESPFSFCLQPCRLRGVGYTFQNAGYSRP